MKKSIARFVSVLLILSFLPTFAFAEEWFLEDGDITVSATDSGQNVSQGSVSREDAAPVIKNRDPSAGSSNTVTIDAGKYATANVTIENTNINASTGDEAGIQTTGEGNVNLNIEGSNTVTGGDLHAGVEKNNSGNLTIGSESGTGKLEANGGQFGAGIGGGYKGDGSNITITGGEINANGGQLGAGIGGGDFGDGSNITVTGGELHANGGPDGAGIGGGYVGACDTVTISGGTVTANGDSGGAGIGGGSFSSGTNISITGGQVSAKAGGSAAGIGGGCQKTGSNITVSGDAQVKVSGGSESFGNWGVGAAIGNGGAPQQNGAEVSPDTSGLYTTGKIEYYEPGSDFEKGLKKTITGTVEPPKTATASVSAPAAETVRGVLYRVTNLDGKDIPYGAQRAEGTLTVTVGLEDAILTGSLSGLKTLKEQNVTAITFVTESGSAAFLLDDILAQGALSDRYALTLSGGTVTFTLAGRDISGILQ